jgi:hypothetical protein
MLSLEPSNPVERERGGCLSLLLVKGITQIAGTLKKDLKKTFDKISNQKLKKIKFAKKGF